MDDISAISQVSTTNNNVNDNNNKILSLNLSAKSLSKLELPETYEQLLTLYIGLFSCASLFWKRNTTLTYSKLKECVVKFCDIELSIDHIKKLIMIVPDEMHLLEISDTDAVFKFTYAPKNVSSTTIAKQKKKFRGELVKRVAYIHEQFLHQLNSNELLSYQYNKNIMKWHSKFDVKNIELEFDSDDINRIISSQNMKDTTCTKHAIDDVYGEFANVNVKNIRKRQKMTTSCSNDLTSMNTSIMYALPRAELVNAKNKFYHGSSGTNMDEVYNNSIVEETLPPLDLQYTYTCKEFLIHLKNVSWFSNQIEFVKQLDAKAPTFGVLKANLHLMIKEWLLDKKIRLFKHQTKAIDSILLENKNVMLSTSTSSGKSLAYNIPIINSIIVNTSYSALYIFPTKSLAQDQLRSLRSFINDLKCNQIKCSTFDGDTDINLRDSILNNSNIILTNPDILHITILPHHSKHTIKRFLSQLKYIVIDEAHYYRQAFGVHVCLIIKRLIRICRMLNNTVPQIICCSATIGNPEIIMKKICGEYRDSEIIKEDGSGNASKLLIGWNPPLKKQNERVSCLYESAMISTELIRCHLPVLTFTPTRLVCEIIFKYIKDNLVEQSIPSEHDLLHNYDDAHHLCLSTGHKKEKKDKNKYLLQRIATYRGGYTTDYRRKVELQLFNNKLVGIVATNALELGIDVGSLDVTVHTGVCHLTNLWQQIGRAGRQHDRESMTIIVAFDSPLDQYYMKNSNKLILDEHAPVLLDANNIHILEQQLLCAAYEYPLELKDIEYFSDDMKLALESMVTKGWIKKVDNDKYIINQLNWKQVFGSATCLSNYSQSKLHQRLIIMQNNQRIYSRKRNLESSFNLQNESPAHAISIRSSQQNDYHVLIGGTDEIINSVPYHKIFFTFYPGAIYLHKGDTYVVNKIDFDMKVVIVSGPLHKIDYHTMQRDHTEAQVKGVIHENKSLLFDDDNQISNNISCLEHVIMDKSVLRYGRLEIVTSVYGYHKIHNRSKKILDTIDLNDLPITTLYTKGAWIDLSNELQFKCKMHDLNVKAAVHAASHVLISLLPIYLLCDNSEFGTECPSPKESVKRAPRILIYDKNDIGSALMVFQLFPKLIIDGYNLLKSCQCDVGCPSCIISHQCTEHNAVSSKVGALFILEELIKTVK